MRKILLIGDSLSMVRPDFGVAYQDTFAYKLQEELEDSILINASVRANSSQNVLTDNYCYETLDALKPDLVIYFLGVVDYMPRLFTHRQRLLLRLLMASKFLKFFGKLIISYKSKRRFQFTKKKLIQFVPIKNWNDNLEKFLSKIGCNVIFINIPFPGHRLLSRNYQVENIVNDYNSSLLYQAKKHNAVVVDFYKITKESPHLLLEDGYHITSEAHRQLTQILLKSITIYDKAN